MMPRYRTPMQPRMTPRHFGPYHGRPPVHPMMGRPQQMMRQGGGGGLLSKLLGKGNQMGAGQSMNATRAFGPQNAAGGGSLLKTLTNPSSINGFLVNTQKVLNTAQQVGPMIQQYGPMVKNLPVMWKLYRGFKNAPDFTENADNNDTNINVESTYTSSQEPAVKPDQEMINSRRKSPSPSMPKLYI
jgi:YqfQ-like protein